MTLLLFPIQRLIASGLSTPKAILAQGISLSTSSKSCEYSPRRLSFSCSFSTAMDEYTEVLFHSTHELGSTSHCLSASDLTTPDPVRSE